MAVARWLELSYLLLITKAPYSHDPSLSRAKAADRPRAAHAMRIIVMMPERRQARCMIVSSVVPAVRAGPLRRPAGSSPGNPARDAGVSPHTLSGINCKLDTSAGRG